MMLVPLTATSTSDEEEFLQLRNWSELPELALHSVLSRLRSFRDFLSFSSVCRSWRSLSSDLSSTSFPPLLLSPSSFRTLPLPFLGYSNGHLLFHSPATGHLLLANVFTGGLARLPSPPDRSLLCGGGGGFRVALLAADSLFLASNSLVLHYRSATRSWREHRHGAASLAVFRNKIFCVDPARKRLTVLNATTGSTETESVQLPVLSGPLILCHDLGYRLAAAGADLLLLRLAFRFSVPRFYPVSRTVDVFRLVDAGRGAPAWEEVEALGDLCVFVDAAGGCATACAEPARWGGRSGCVYVTGPGCDGWVEVPVAADGGDRRFEMSGSGARDLNMNPPRWPSPVWVHPPATKPFLLD